MKVFLFNPETDYARADDKLQYTAPKNVVALRQTLACLPAIWAQSEDAIIITDKLIDTSYSHLAEERNIRIISLNQLERDDDIIPWGWNRALVYQLNKLGINNLPSDEQLNNLRRLSHRRMTRLFHSSSTYPIELTDVIELKQWINSHSDGFLKAPWSSSGRGVRRVSEMSRDTIEKWGGGIIRRQGSVMAEVAWDKTLDFATEWICVNGNAKFSGFSVFYTSKSGKYTGNLSADNETLRGCISQHCEWNEDILSFQQTILNKYFAPFYSGPLGIDMLSDTSGNINPCVEVNLRHTMGMAAAALFRLTGRKQIWNPLNGLPNL